MRISYSAHLLRRIVLSVLFAACCSTQFRASQTDTWKKALDFQQTFVKYRVVDKNAPRSIVLIGENHASVKTQLQLAELLKGMYEADGVDAVLVEGSNGPIDASKLRSSVGKASGENTNDFWKGKLLLGQLAGYEYIALTQKNKVLVWGVEDMDAKREYTVGSARRTTMDGLREEAELHKRALGLAKQASTTLDPPAAEQSNVQTELKVYEGKITSFAALTETEGPKYADAEATSTEAVERLTALYSKLQPLLPDYERVAKEADSYDRLLERAKRIAASAGSAPSDADAENLLAQLRAGKTRLEQLSTKFDNAAKKNGYANTESVLADLKQIGDTETVLRASEPQITKLAESFGKQEAGLRNQLFVVANAIRAAAGKPVPELQSFLRDEQERARADKRDTEVPFLTDRDQHMVSNTMTFFANNPTVRTVALIVGYAHLDGLTIRFTKEQVNILAGKLSSSEDEIEPWEDRAWLARSRPAERIFSEGAKRKELSRLLDQTYTSDMKKLLSQLQSLNATGAGGLRVGNSRIFEFHSGIAGTKAIVVTSDAGGLRANWGSYVVDSGVLPDGSGNNYQIFDRARALTEAKGASTTRTLFGTAYQTHTPNGPTTKIAFSTGAETVDRFKSTPPKSRDSVPERVVLATEGDSKPLNTALGNGGSGGSGEPPWTTPLASFAEPPGRRIPFLFFTKNINRARKGVAALESEEPLRIGQIASFELGFDQKESNGLEALWFTPSRGDHARVFLVSGENTEQFRKQLKEAAAAGLLENKQIALATCFDPKETDALREMLLDAGALMVWTPENRISPEAARKLLGYMEKVDETYAAQPPKALDEYMNKALELWYRNSPDDPDLKPLLGASRWVDLQMFILGTRSKTAG